MREVEVKYQVRDKEALLVALKRRGIEFANALSCDEYETAVADREQMDQAILAMGFCPTVRIAKVRRTAVLDGLVLCVDNVEGLGTFLELERLVPDGTSGEAVQAEMAAFVMSLEVEVERTGETYDSLVRAALASA